MESTYLLQTTGVEGLLRNYREGYIIYYKRKKMRRTNYAQLHLVFKEAN